MFAGNVAEGTTLEEMLKGLAASAGAWHRTEGHRAITVLAYRPVQAIRLRLKPPSKPRWTPSARSTSRSNAPASPMPSE